MVAQCEQLVALGVFFLVAVQQGSAIHCWDCNSHYDPNCADPFRKDTFSLSDCEKRRLSHYPNTTATVCRKIVQKVKDDYRFIRTCGWLNGDKEGAACIKRAGTFNVLVQYCSCKGDGCNGAPSATSSWATAGLALAAVTAQWAQSNPN